MLVCRCCLTFEDNLYSFLDYEVAFQECTGLLVEDTALICPSCIRKLNEASAFRSQSIKSDAYLRKKQADMTFGVLIKSEPVDVDDEADEFHELEPVVKVEEAPKMEDFDDDFDMNDGDESEDEQPPILNVTFDESGKEIPEEEPKKRRRKRKTEVKNERPPSPGHSMRAKQAWEYTKDNLIKECPYCFATGLKKIDLKKHIQEHVDAHGGYECAHCQRKFRKKRVLKQHIFTRHGVFLGLAGANLPVTLTCNECKETFQGLRLLRTHYRERHPGVQMEEPSISGSFTCSECGKQLSSKYTLEMHEMVHTGLRPFVCTICGRGYRAKEHLRYHEMSHTGERPFLCQVCGKSFKTKENLRTHEPIHTGDLNYPCPTCGKRFRTSNLLKYHLYCHDENPQFACEICGKKFRQLTNLRSHRSVHIENPELNFACDICGKRFKARNLLKSHLLSHDETLRHSCDICGLKFRHASNWRSHKLSHSEQRDFGCGECGTPFKQRYSLKRHMRQHAVKVGIDETSFELRKGDSTRGGFREEAFLIRN